MKKFIVLSVTLLFLGAFAGAASANLLTNGNFESGLSGWSYDDVSIVSKWDSKVAKLSDGHAGNAYLAQSFFIEPGVTELHIGFDYLFTGRDDAAWYSDVFGSGISIQVADDWWIFDNYEVEALVLMDSEADSFGTKVSYHGSIDLSAIDFINVDPNATILFDLVELRGFCSDYTNTKVFLDNVNVAAAPVPEPATILLFGSGLIGIAGVSRKKILKKK